MLTEVRFIFEKLITLKAANRWLVVFSHVMGEKLFFLEDLMALGARVNLAIEMNKAVNAQFLFHLEAERTFGAFEIRFVDFQIFMYGFLM